jgi:hypothetical protein
MAVFAFNNAASTLGGTLTPFFIDCGAHPSIPLSPPCDNTSPAKTPASYAECMRAMEATIWKVASWYIPLLDGIYHAEIGKYHMVYTMHYTMIYSMVYTLSFTIWYIPWYIL